MSKLYKRFCKLVVAEDSRNQLAVDFSRFRIVFSITNTLSGAPPTADIRIYNVSDDTVSRIRQEGQTVILQAGYEDNKATVFQGDLVQRYKGTVMATPVAEDSRLDSVLQIVARTNDKAHTYGMINTCLPAGANAAHLAKEILDEYARYGMKPGALPDLPPGKLTRGKVFYRPLKKALDDFCRTYGLQSCYSGNELGVVPVDETFREKPIVLNENSGLIGTPVMSIAGLKLRMLMRPEIRLNSTLQIANRDILYDDTNKTPPASSSTSGTEEKKDGSSAKKESGQPTVSKNAVDVNGLYKIVSITHKGDTRGKDWYMELVCTAANPTARDSTSSDEKES